MHKEPSKKGFYIFAILLFIGSCLLLYSARHMYYEYVSNCSRMDFWLVFNTEIIDESLYTFDKADEEYYRVTDLEIFNDTDQKELHLYYLNSENERKFRGAEIPNLNIDPSILENLLESPAISTNESYCNLRSPLGFIPDDKYGLDLEN